MGYMRHHAIIVSGHSDEMVKVREKVLSLAARCVHVTELTPNSMNGTRSFMVAPDGSKEGWEESDAGDASREAIKKYLKSLAYADGSTSYKWAEVQFGDDEGKTKIVDDSDAEYRANKSVSPSGAAGKGEANGSVD